MGIKKELDERDTVRDLAGKPKDTLRGLNEGAPGADEPPPSSGARSVVVVSAPDSTRPPVDTAAPKRNTLPKGGPGEAARPSKKNSVPRLLAGSVTQPPTWQARKVDRAGRTEPEPEEAPEPSVPVRSSRRGIVIAAGTLAVMAIAWWALRSPSRAAEPTAPQPAEKAPARTAEPPRPVAPAPARTAEATKASAAQPAVSTNHTPKGATAPTPPTAATRAAPAVAPKPPRAAPSATASSKSRDPNELLFPPSTN